MPMRRLSADDQVLVWPNEMRDWSADGKSRHVMTSAARGAVTGTELWPMSATQLAAAIRSGQVSNPVGDAAAGKQAQLTIGYWVRRPPRAVMPGVSTRWMTVIAFALGMAACTANQRELGEVYGATREGPRVSGLYIALATVLGIVMLAAGILAFVLASKAMLATLVVAMVALWLIATGRHALTAHHRQLAAHSATH